MWICSPFVLHHKHLRVHICIRMEVRDLNNFYLKLLSIFENLMKFPNQKREFGWAAVQILILFPKHIY